MNKELKNKDLEQVSGGAQRGEILCSSRNKGTSACSSISHDESGNLIIIKREKNSAEK